MNKYLISYDLGGPETRQDYTNLITYIKNYNHWAKPLKSVWFIATDKDVATVRDELRNLMDSNDKVLVIEVTGNWGTFGIEKIVTDWMQESL